MSEVAAIVLSAGRSSRFGSGDGDSKVLALHEGLPLISHVLAALRASRAAPLVVVTGHAAAEVAAALDGQGGTFVHNANYADGMAGSLKVGLAALPPRSAGVLILLGDMPLVKAATLDGLIEEFVRGDVDAVVPTFEGRRGNPVLIARALFPAIMCLQGDEGARLLLKATASVSTLPVDDPGIVVDVDTPEALRGLENFC